MNAVNANKHHCYFIILFAIWLFYLSCCVQRRIVQFVTTTFLSDWMDWNNCRRKREALGTGNPVIGQRDLPPGNTGSTPTVPLHPVLCAGIVCNDTAIRRTCDEPLSDSCIDSPYQKFTLDNRKRLVENCVADIKVIIYYNNLWQTGGTIIMVY